jgi:hypothetical protein
MIDFQRGIDTKYVTGRGVSRCLYQWQWRLSHLAYTSKYKYENVQ